MNDLFQWIFSWWTCPYLDCFLDVNARVSYGLQQLIEPSHFLNKHCVHALSVCGWVSPHCRLNIKVVWKFTQDVTSNLIHHFFRWFCTSICRTRLGRVQTMNQKCSQRSMPYEVTKLINVEIRTWTGFLTPISVKFPICTIISLFSTETVLYWCFQTRAHCSISMSHVLVWKSKLFWESIFAFFL